jgi:hypothetical protein
MKKTILILGMAAFVGLIVHPIQAQSKTEKEAAVLKYKDKFLIVKIDGISVGAAGEGLCASRGPANIIGDAGDIQIIERFNCGAEPIHKGEVLKISDVHLTNIHRGHYYKGNYLALSVVDLSPHSITRGDWRLLPPKY